MIILSKYKWVLIIVGVVLVVEIIWIFKFAGQSATLPVAANPENISDQPMASIILSVPKTTFQVGEKIPVSINIDSIKATDGTDLVLIYDPSLVNAADSVAVGTIYSDYPLNASDNTAGKISVSGISSDPLGKVARGVFGTATFEAKAPGKVKIAVDFTKGSTIDSNIIETKTTKDLLGKVGNVEVEIK